MFLPSSCSSSVLSQWRERHSCYTRYAERKGQEQIGISISCQFSDLSPYLRFESFPSRVSIFLERSKTDLTLHCSYRSRDVSSPVPAHLQFLASGVKDTVVTPDMLKERVKNKSA